MSTQTHMNPAYVVLRNSKIAGQDLVAGDVVAIPADVVARLSPGVVVLKSEHEAQLAEAERQQRQAAEDAARKQAEESQAKIVARRRAIETSGPEYAKACADALARRLAPILQRRDQQRGLAPWPARDAALAQVQIIERNPVRETRGPANMALVERPLPIEDEREILDRDLPSQPAPPSGPAPGGAAALIESFGSAYGAAIDAARRRYGGGEAA